MYLLQVPAGFKFWCIFFSFQEGVYNSPSLYPLRTSDYDFIWTKGSHILRLKSSRWNHREFMVNGWPYKKRKGIREAGSQTEENKVKKDILEWGRFKLRNDKDCQGPKRLEKIRKDSPFRFHRLTDSLIQTSVLFNYEKIDFSYFSPPSFENVPSIELTILSI
jgi:hypothetical protein